MWRKLLFLISITWMISSSNSAEMQCQWNGDMCQSILSITPVTKANEIITVSGKPLGYTNTLSYNLRFTNFFLKYVPTNFFSTFTAMKYFAMVNCSTTELVTDSFKNCGLMISILISDGNIPYVSEGFAQTCSNIESIWLSRNNIEVIDKNAFRGLVKMTLLDLSFNKLTCVHPDVFQTAPMLINIILNYNKIAGIDRNLFRGLKSLLNVYVSYNLIRYLPSLNLAQGNLNAMSILFNGNPIYAINPNFCSTFSTRSVSFNDLINLKISSDLINIPCLPAGSTFNQITKANCASSAGILQSCYANYSTAMSDFVPCEGSPICIPGSVWYKFMDFLKTLIF